MRMVRRSIVLLSPRFHAAARGIQRAPRPTGGAIA